MLSIHARHSAGVWARTLIAAVLCSLSTSHVRASGFVELLDTPATLNHDAERAPLLAIARAGQRLVAVGMRGLIIYSDDLGASWIQARVPVQSDLTAVNFVNARNGWAVGQESVILHTEDGGASWLKQFDSRLSVSFKSVYQKRLDAGDASVKPFTEIVDLNFRGGSELPWLGVVFENLHDGYAVGPYGMLTMTHDGGEHWAPWLDHIDNPQFLYLDGIRLIDGEVYITGEKGRVYRLDRVRQYFVAMDTKYAGSLFGITGHTDQLVAYGLLGHVYRSVDHGANWRQVPTGLSSLIADATLLPDGQIVMASQSGEVLIGNAQADSLKFVKMQHVFPFAGLSPDGGAGLALVGLGGVTINPMPKSRSSTVQN